MAGEYRDGPRRRASKLLTIGQLAEHVGVTARAVRHYHQRGLLAEPERDSSGYRRYDAQAVIDLIRIKTLSDAGVPLARIAKLMDATPEEFVLAIAEIDEALDRRMRELADHRTRMAALVAGERLFLPPLVVDLLDELRDLGVSERNVKAERDGWILVWALSPDLVAGWVQDKRSLLEDDEFRRLYLAFDEATGWDGDDPRLPELIDSVVAYLARHPPTAQRAAAGKVEEVPAVALLSAYVATSSPAWTRMSELVRDKKQGPATAAGAGSSVSP